MFKRCAIHAEVIVVSSRRRKAILTFFRIPFPPLHQFFLPPPHFLQPFFDQPVGFVLGRFPNLLPAILWTRLLAHLRQQFLAEGFVPQAPTPQKWFELRPVLNGTAKFHPPLEFLAPDRGVFWDAVLSK